MLTRTAVAVVMLASLGSPDCPGDPTKPAPPKFPSGTWGGDNAGLIADDTSAHVHIGCTYGNIHHRIELRAGGQFDMVGEYNITAHPVDRGIMHPARFTGRVTSLRMTLTVTLADTAVTLGPVVLILNQEPRMGPCPICRRPAARR